MPAQHVKSINTNQILAALSHWKSGDVCIEWLRDDPPDAAKQERRANILMSHVTSDDVWRILDNECLKGKTAEEVIESAIGMTCEPVDMTPGIVVRACEINLTSGE